MTNPNNPLLRSREHRIIAGVCGGLAKWLGWDPTVLRIVYIIVSLVSAAFPGFIVYVVLWILMPEESAAPQPKPARQRS